MDILRKFLIYILLPFLISILAGFIVYHIISQRKKKHLLAIIDKIGGLKKYGDLIQDLAQHPEVIVSLIGSPKIEGWQKERFEHPRDRLYIYEKKEEAEALPLIEKQAYCYICALDRFGLPMPAPLIKRILGEDVNGALEGLVEKGVIRLIDEKDYYISRHKVVAESIFWYLCTKLPDFHPFELYKNILQKATFREEELMVHLFQTYLERDLTAKLKDDLREKYEKTFSKTKSAELLGLGWGPIFDEFYCYDLAEIAYRKSLAINENQTVAHNNYANLLAKLERYLEAEVHYKRALELKEDDPAAHTNYANLLAMLKRYPEAEVRYRRALELKKDYPEAHYNYAILLVNLERYKEAEERYKMALELRENYHKAHYNYAILLQEMKRYPEAEVHYKMALELKEDDSLAIAMLGFLYLNEGFWQPEKASYWLKKAWEHRERLPDKGESVKKALEALSSEKGQKKEEKPPENEL